ncbi:MAG: hypothetical protein ISS66_11830 [Desulfobacteraceae bacterium]|nr:hypothetical protein [Desulfobacteraceae bacterium]
MKKYTGRERVILAYDRQYADRVPTDIQGLIIGYIALGFSTKEFMTDPEKAAAVFIKSWEMVQQAAVKNCLEIASGESGYILASGCAIPPNTPLENIQSFMEAADKYGRYDDS